MSVVMKHMRETLRDHVLEEIPAGERIKAFYIKEPGTRMGSSLILFTPEGIAIMGDLTPGRGAMSVYGYGLSWFASELGEDYLCGKFLEKEWVPEYAADYCRWMAKEVRKGQYDDDEFLKVRKLANERANLGHDLVLLRKDLHGAVEGEDVAGMKAEGRELCRKLGELRSQIVEAREKVAALFLELARDVEEWAYGCERFAEEVEEIEPGACEDGVPGYGYKPSDAGWLCAIQQRFSELYLAQVQNAKKELEKC